MTKKRTTSVPSTTLVKAYFPANRIPQLKRTAKRQGLSVSSLVVTTVLRDLDQAEREAR